MLSSNRKLIDSVAGSWQIWPRLKSLPGPDKSAVSMQLNVIIYIAQDVSTYSRCEWRRGQPGQECRRNNGGVWYREESCDAPGNSSSSRLWRDDFDRNNDVRRGTVWTAGDARERRLVSSDGRPGARIFVN